MIVKTAKNSYVRTTRLDPLKACAVLLRREAATVHIQYIYEASENNLFAVFVQLTLDMLVGGCVSCWGDSKSIQKLHLLFIVDIHFQLQITIGQIYKSITAYLQM